MEDQKLPLKYPIPHQENKEIRRITFKNGISQIFDALNLQKGWLYTLKSLLLDPGGLVKYYLGVGRYSTISPWKLLFLTTALSLFLIIQFDLNSLFTNPFIEGTNESSAGIEKVNADIFIFFNDYYNIILWSSIPVFALVFFLILRRSFNYFEHVIIYTYYLVLGNIFVILLLPVFALTNWGFGIYLVITHFYIVYTYIRALDLTQWHQYIKLFLAITLSYILYFIVLVFSAVPIIMNHVA